ncbi:PH domain-containing protein [Streptomyces sp. P1-3]|uniref:PH domain-containing protein n=1 Tax=Streptomyces sp. P1-3 TaxID=3421658 RepID=UPI003D36E859
MLDGTFRALGKCLDNARNASTNGNRISLFDCHGGPAQPAVDYARLGTPAYLWAVASAPFMWAARTGLGWEMTGAADGGPQVRKYRAPLAMSVFVTVFFGGGGLSVLGPFFVEDRAPIVLVVAMVALVAPLVVLLVAAVWRSMTIVDQDHVAVRRVFRTRRTAWCDIQAIEIDGNAAAVADETQPTGIVTIYDRDGRRFTLPHLHDRRGLSVYQEVLAMREMWERQRGEDWTPLPVTEVAVTKAEAQTRTAGTIMAASQRGRAAAMGTLCVQTVLFLTLMFTGALDDLPDIPEGLFIGVFMGLPVVAFVAVLLTSIARDRRR